MNKIDADYISKHDIAKRYLQGKLTPEETVEFEEYIMDKPELLEQLELDSVMVEHLPLVKTSAKQELEEKNGLQPSFWQVLFGTPLRASIGTALGCAMVAVLWFDKPNIENNSNFSPNIVYLESYRSANNVTTLDFKLGEAFKIIAIDVPPNSGNEFEVTIMNKNGQLVSAQQLMTNESHEVTFLLYRNVLIGERYRMELMKDNHIVYAFDLVVKKT